MPEQLINLLIHQLQRKLSSWLTEVHLIANHDLQDLNQLSQFYKWLDWSYHNVIFNITWCERHCQWINQKVFTSPVASPCVAKSLKPIQHDLPHYKLHWATVSTCSDKCWRCGELGHFDKNCTKPKINKPAQIKEVEFWFNNQLFCQNFKV